MHSAVTDNTTGQAIEDAELEVGGRVPSGLEQQVAGQGDYNLRTGSRQDGTENTMVIGCDHLPFVLHQPIICHVYCGA